MQFNGNKRYNDYSSFIKNHFGERVQKISLDTGFTCPNRDGSKGVGGCTLAAEDLTGKMPTEKMLEWFDEKGIVTGLDMKLFNEAMRKALTVFP